MHLDFSVSVGQIAVIITLLGVLWRVERVYNLYSIEHEMLMTDLCDRKGIKLHMLPTRSKGLGSSAGG